MNVLIRVDGNEIIASGHMMRCFTIAKILLQRGVNIVFAVSDENSEKLLLDTEFEYICLHTDWNNLLMEVPTLLQLIEKEKIDVILIDTYSLTNEYCLLLKDKVKIACFDDLFLEKYDVNLIINYNIFCQQFDYKERYGNSSTQLLLGTAYVPLREEFRNPIITNRNQIDSVLLICGGGDYLNVLGNYLSTIVQENCDIMWHVVVGSYNKNEKELETHRLKSNNIFLHKNVKKMCELISSCDLIVSAASTVLYECLACRKPVQFFCVADNQELDIQAFQEYANMLYLGDARENMDVVIRNSLNWINDNRRNSEMMRKMIDRSKELIDCDGAYRIADEIVKLA